MDNKTTILAMSLDKIASKPPVTLFLAEKQPRCLYSDADSTKEVRDKLFNSGRRFSESKIADYAKAGRKEDALDAHHSLGAVITEPTWAEVARIVETYFPFALNALTSIMQDAVRLADLRKSMEGKGALDGFVGEQLQAQANDAGRDVEKFVVEALQNIGKKLAQQFNLLEPNKISGFELY